VTLSVEGVAAPVEARLGVINDKVDARTRGVEIRLRVPNPDLSIKPGLFATLTLHPTPRQATVIDRAAMLGSYTDPYVFVPAAKVARRLGLRVRDLDAGLVEVLDGLKPGDVALAGPNLPDIRDGAAIAVRTDHGTR
jgi:membrane fusion protein (multidrug efflux system)